LVVMTQLQSYTTATGHSAAIATLALCAYRTSSDNEGMALALSLITTLQPPS